MTISLLIKTPKLHHVRDITLNSLHHPAHNTYSISNSPMVLQDITYMINPTFEEVMDKLVIETLWQFKSKNEDKKKHSLSNFKELHLDKKEL